MVVLQSLLEHSVVISAGFSVTVNVILAKFYISAMELNGYYDRVQEKLVMVDL